MTGLIVLLILAVLVFVYNIYTCSREQQQQLHSLINHSKDLARQIAVLTNALQQQKQENLLPPSPAKEIEKIIIPDSKPVLAKPAAKQEEEPDEKLLTKQIADSATNKKNWLWNTDIEKFIGENLANKIGIAVLVLGISFFVKYAIDKNWINETGRVVIGLACGSILAGIAHYIRNSYRSFSSVLIGGGLTVFYFTIAFAFHQYQLIGQQTAFVCMVVITAFAVGLSVLYNRQELAILATIGGFVTPFLVSTGQENYIALFSYLGILCTGLMALSWFKKWPAINIIALFFTTIIYGGWLIRRVWWMDESTIPFKNALFFATVFYLLFIAMNIINNLRLKRRFRALDFFIVLGTNFLYYTAAMIVLQHWSNGRYQGLFTVGLGLFNLVLAGIFYPKKNTDRNFVALLIGLSLGFISLSAPVQFNGNNIVLFWATESVVLYWLYQRSQINQLKIASLLVTVLMLGSLLITWINIYVFSNDTVPVIINKGFVTGFVCAIALFIYSLLLRKQPIGEAYLPILPTRQARDSFLTASIIVAYMAGTLEIVRQFGTRFPQQSLSVIYWQAYSFAVAIIVIQLFRKAPLFPVLKFLLTGLCFGIYLFCIGSIYYLSFELLSNSKDALFTAHWVAVLLLAWLLYNLVVFFFRGNMSRWQQYRQGFICIATIGIILLLSVEMYQVILWTSYRDQGDWIWWQNLYYKAGLSILWSICSFTLMWLGMKYSFRELRIISLSLFTVTLVKLFVYDMRNIPPGGKIAAFILLGVILLTVSFMYQRLKKIIIDKTEE